MAKAKLIKYVGGWASLRDNPIYEMSEGRLPIDASTWSDALPSGKHAHVITLDTVYSEPVYGHDDFTMTVSIRFIGDFTDRAVGWKGPIEYVKIFKDGALAATIKTDDKINFHAIDGETNSGIIWDKIALGGLKGQLSADNNWFNASSGNDVIHAGRGIDMVRGWDGNDRLFGDGGNDTLLGYNGNDRLYGGNGDDDMKGLAGDDRLFGGPGRDIFREEDTLGLDKWTGGKGADTFEIGYFDNGRYGATVTDFRPHGGDKVDLRSDDAFFFFEFDSVRYIGDAAFSGETGVYEVRMNNGIVEVDNNHDGDADLGIKLAGHDSFHVHNTNWLILPDGFDFA